MTTGDSVTVVGLGLMGTALAEAFLENGHDVTVWNRTASKADALVEKGASRAGSAAAAVSASDLLVLCLLDDASVHEVLDPVAAGLSGRTVVNLTTGAPSDARKTAAWATAAGADYLDGGIMAVPPMIGTPSSMVLYSGSQTAFSRYEKVLSELGAARYVGEDAGLASLHDLAMLTGMYGVIFGAVQAFALVGTERVPATEFMTFLGPWIDAMMPVLPQMAQQVDSGDHNSEVVSNLEMQATAFETMVRTSREQGISADLLIPMRDLMRRAVATSRGGDDTSSLVDLVRQPG